jgi:serine/threonine protein kinase
MSKPSWIGKSLSGRYQIEEMIGQGGMSAVYKATDPNLKRVVAIKMIHPHLSDDPDFVKRFEEEAAAVAQLRHPNIIQVFDFNHDAESDSYYMVLEFVPGETLQQHLARLNASGRKLSITKALESMIDICEAVNYAHQRGMIHRDIKPANLMLTVTGQAILMDFGIAKIVGGQRHTATGAVVGTAMYMSPEQIKGEHPDRRSDIYSLGVTLFEMVSGRPPFEADSAMTLMMMHVNDPVPDPRTLNPDVPDDLVTVIDKALAKDPNDRYQTAAQMAAALRNILGRIKAGASLETPVSPGATMVETPDMTPAGKPGATVVEDPGVSFESSGGTYVEPVSTPVESAPGTQVETTPPPPRATGSVAGTGGIGSGGAAIGGSAAEPAPAKGTPTKILGLSLPVIAGAALVLVCLLGGGIFMVSRLFAGPGASPLLPPPATETATATEVVDTPLPSATPTLEITSTPTETPLPSATPTATVPPGIPFARINSITIDDQNRYVVEYETFEFTEKLPGMHVHFFFNTVSPENAGVPGSGPWILYGGPRPFTKYRVSDRPAQATQMCILVANPNHSVQPNSGNCMDLPEPQ